MPAKDDLMDILRVLDGRPPFTCIGKNELHKIAMTFQRHVYPKGSFLVEQGKRMPHIGLIESGVADLMAFEKNGNEINCGVLKKGDFFGFIAMMRNDCSMYNLICREPVNCYVQKSHDFFSMIETEVTVRDFFYQTALDSMINTLLRIKHADGSAAVKKEPVRRDLSPAIERALDYIDNNFSRSLTLNEVAEKSGMSKYHFCRVFKSKTGKSFTEYLNKKRIEAAKHLLTSRKVNVSEVCFAVGFNDLSYFTRVFKEVSGRKPSEFKSGKMNTDATRCNANA
jgi:AraC-like DNA-binding protein